MPLTLAELVARRRLPFGRTLHVRIEVDDDPNLEVTMRWRKAECLLTYSFALSSVAVTHSTCSWRTAGSGSTSLLFSLQYCKYLVSSDICTGGGRRLYLGDIRRAHPAYLEYYAVGSR